MEPTTCPNCGSPVDSHFCPNCGQRNEPVQLTWHSLTGSLISTLIGDHTTGIKDHNARYGIFYTLRMLFLHPGTLIGEYIAGRRCKYFDPVTLLLLLSSAYIIFASLLGQDTIPNIEFEDTEQEMGQYLKQGLEYYKNHPWLWYMLQLPFAALAFKWIFRRRSSMRYMEYLYVGLFIALFSLVLSIAELPIKTYAPDWLQNVCTGSLWLIRLIFAVAVFRTLFRVSTVRGVWNYICTQAITIAGTGLTILFVIFIYFCIYYAILE